MSSKYYNVKPKAKARLSYGHAVAVMDRSEESESGLEFAPKGQIMDLAFVNAESVVRARPIAETSSLWLVWVKLTGLLVTGVLLYAGGAVLYQGATQIKQETITTVNRGVAKIEAAAQAVTLKNLPEAKTNLIAAENLFASAQKDILSLGQTNLYMSGLGSEQFQIIAGQKLIDAGLNLAQGGQLLIATAEPAMKYFDNTNPTGATVAQTTEDFLPQVILILSGSSRNLDKALAKIAKADNLLQSIQPSALGAEYSTTLSIAQGKASTLHDLVAMMDTIAKQLPRALGNPNPRSYLIMNQNDTELRPTGGFMGSYAMLKLHRGKITDFFVDDTYRIDGQLTGSQTGEKVIPNANFDPDFPASAKYISNLYEESGGGTPDGVIAINTQVMSAIMTIIGDIELPERRITITADNFANVVYGEVQKVEKTSNPKAILSELNPILMQRIMSLSREDLNKLTPLLLEQITKKNIMLYTRNADLQRVLSQMDWSGELKETAPKEDFLMVVRANMGGVKSSKNITDTIQHQVNVSSTGEITEKLILTYTHTGTGKSPDGINKDYVRVYLPKGATVKNIIGYDVADKIVTEPAHEKTFFGFYVTTKPGETKIITLDYQPPFTLDSSKGESYSLYVQKQAGTTNTSFTSTLKTPSAGLTTGNLKQLFKGSLVGDIVL